MRSDVYPGLVRPWHVFQAFGVWLKVWRETIFEISLDTSLDIPEGFCVIPCLNNLRQMMRGELMNPPTDAIFPGETI
jgi:hypothetical protein